MKIWLDTTNNQSIQKAVRLGILAGVTTNPSILSKVKKSREQLLKDLLHYQEGPVAVQIESEEIKEMVQEGQYLYSISNRIIIKVPITKNGLEVIHLLSRQGIPTMATVLFTPHQALMAALAGAEYIAPYINRLEKAGGDPWSTLRSITDIFHNYKLKTKILAASIGNLEQVIKCAEIGIYGMTIKDEIFDKLMEDYPLTSECLEIFSKDIAQKQMAILN